MKYKNNPDILVLALPRGGVPVGYEIAKALNATLDVFVVRKLGVPGHEELGMGAIASGGARVLNDQVIRQLHISPETIDSVTSREEMELQRRERLYRGDRSALNIHNKTVILVDDGLATGSSMKAAIAAVRQQNPARIVVAVPTAPVETCAELKAEADEVICAMTPECFRAVGEWYGSFPQTTDAEVRDLMKEAA
jgi:predicted phosphoribosyltransferase